MCSDKMQDDIITHIDWSDDVHGQIFKFHYADGHVRTIHVRTDADMHEVHHLIEHAKVNL